MGKVDATEDGNGMILDARLAEENVDTDSTVADKGDSIAFRNQYIGCSTCGFTAAGYWSSREGLMATTTLEDPGSMTCDSCSGTLDASETKPCCTAQRLESGVPVDDWKPSASLPPARPVNPRSGSSRSTLYELTSYDELFLI